MSILIPRDRVSFVAARLAAEGHTLMTAPRSLIARALGHPAEGEEGEGAHGSSGLAGRLGLDSTNQAP